MIEFKAPFLVEIWGFDWDILMKRKDPSPEGPALVHPGGVIGATTFTSSVQVSGVRCQQPNSTSCVGFAHEMDFLSPVLAFSCN